MLHMHAALLLRVVGLWVAVVLMGCMGEGPNSPNVDSSSSSASGSSSGLSSSSSSSSSSSGNNRQNAGLSILQVCPSSVGVAGDGFTVEDSFHGRVDFADLDLDPAYVLSSFSKIYYWNSSNTPIAMKLWTNGSAQSREVVFTPGTSQQTVDLGDAPANRQVSLTATGQHPGLQIFGIEYSFELACGPECEEQVVSIGSCPLAPLPGVFANPNPVGPIARAQYTVESDHNAPLTVQVNARMSYDANLEPLRYHWDFDDGQQADGEYVTHSFENPGIYYVRLTVTDPTGASDHDLLPIKVTSDDPDNLPPTARITVDRELVLRPHTVVNLSAVSSSDGDGDSLEYVWYIEKRKEAVRGREIQLDLKDATRLSIRLDVSDGRGGFASASQSFYAEDMPDHVCEIRYLDRYPDFDITVKVYNVEATPLTAWRLGWMFNSPVALEENIDGLYAHGALVEGSNPYFFSGLPDNKDIPAYSWKSFAVSGESDSLVQDIGIESVNGLACVEIMPERSNQPPRAKFTATPQAGAFPLEVLLDASDSIDPNGDAITMYEWQFEDGSVAEGMRITRVYDQPGLYFVSLVVADEELQSASEAVAITVFEAPEP